ncbi:bifunctional DNA primase/polymerase [Streptantibioticus parmotrematis]|uniref:bifunctional DNA primase/polymerase n=1 Tax=Streptantibioticus parmotrematis TaxID=2873249 RepID=UPI00207BEA28|nr:hypothetical protein [Streptantibioticus parmotrematis]
MTDMTWDIRNGDVRPTDPRRTGVPGLDLWQADTALHSEYVTVDGAEWLASASAFPRSVKALWSARPSAPSVLPCGTVFDVVNLPALFGRRMLERLWTAGPGCGPVALQNNRVLVFAEPGTADRLPSLLSWEEWGERVPRPLCHGAGDAVTVPPLVPDPPQVSGDASGTGTGDTFDPAEGGGEGGAARCTSRWLVAPGVRDPWLPGAAVLLWACLRAARAEGTAPA